MRWTVLCALMLTMPTAAAGPAPVIGFFADTEQGPAADGIITEDWPDTNESRVRAVVPEVLGQQLVAFQLNGSPPGTHLKGSMFAGLWPDAGAAKDSYLRLVVSVDDEVVAESMTLVNVDPESAPDPMTLIPPDPTDPEGTVYYELSKILPLIVQPPTLVDMGTINVEVPEGSSVQVSMSLVGPDGGPPTGTSVVLKYDGILSPSFIYLPWWSEDPEAESPQLANIPEPEPAEPAQPPEPAEPSAPAENPAGEDSPGVGVLVVLALIGVAMLRRRR